MKCPNRCNCFVFAWWLYLTRGGYCCLRKSHYYWGWHWLWSADLLVWLSYKPLYPLPLPVSMFHKFWFQGHIVIGDANEI